MPQYVQIHKSSFCLLSGEAVGAAVIPRLLNKNKPQMSRILQIHSISQTIVTATYCTEVCTNMFLYLTGSPAVRWSTTQSWWDKLNLVNMKQWIVTQIGGKSTLYLLYLSGVLFMSIQFPRTLFSVDWCEEVNVWGRALSSIRVTDTACSVNTVQTGRGLTIVPELLSYLGVVRPSHDADLHFPPERLEELVQLRVDFLVITGTCVTMNIWVDWLAPALEHTDIPYWAGRYIR